MTKLTERLGEFSVFAVCETIEDRGEWISFSLMLPGNQYPFKVSTKKEDVIAKGRELRGPEGATWHINALEGEKMNEHTGKPYVNRYLNDVTPGNTATADTVAPTASGNATSAPSDAMTKEDWNEKDRRDYRSRSWAHTISAFSHTIKVDEDPPAVFGRLSIFQALIYRSICGDRAFAYPDSGSSPPVDDDIPF